MKNPLAFTAALGAAALLLAGCGGPVASDSGSSGALTDVTVGTLPIVTNTVLALGVDKGFFKEEGLNVKLASAQGGAALVPAVVSGQYDFAFSNNVSLLTARARGLPIKIVAAASSAGTNPAPPDEAIVVGPGNNAQSLADLNGSTVAVNGLKNMVEIADRVALEKAGVDLSTVSFVEVGFPDMPAALASGRINVAHVAEPFLSQAVKGGARILSAPYREVLPDIFMSSWFTNDKVVAENPDKVKAFQRALEKSRAYASENVDEVRAFIPNFLKMDATVAKEIAMGNWPAGMPSEASLQAWYDACVKYGVLSQDALKNPTDILAG
jgi:NitT/TauT family transport system substrate-binding protein